jgi:hypothetical protein
MGWTAAGDGYQVALESGAVVCRNAKGRRLRSVPAALRDDPAVVGLRQLNEWLARHTGQCRADAERWMIRSLPVPTVLLAQVWADEAWRAALTDLLVAGCDERGRWESDGLGFLRDVGADGVGVVNLDGETLNLAVEQIVIPHPVLMDDLDDLREFATDLAVTQAVDQLFRQTWSRPATVEPASTAIREYAGGRFQELRHLTARAATLGYPVRGGYAVCRIFEAGRAVEARSWVGSDDPYYETETGELVFVSARGKQIPLGEVTPVAWSEGMRMAAALFAGRIVETSTEDEA